MSSDPWSSISKPRGIGVSARRVDPEHRFHFYWALDRDGHCLLVMEYANTVQVRDKRPKLGEIRIIETHDDDEPARLVLQLTRDENREIFHQLCLDIVDSTRACGDERSALATVIRRTWRWHGMLKGGSDERLDPERQKGLIGELRVLETAILPFFSASDSLEFWRGPAGAPKDFSIGAIAIESKAKRGSSRPFVRISSEDQLDTTGVQALYLAVTYVDEGAPELDGSLTLTDYVNHASRLVESKDVGSLGFLEGRLDEAGYSSTHDYSDRYWIIRETRWYTVTLDFPTLAKSRIPSGIEKVNYNLDIGSCNEWETDLGELQNFLETTSSDRRN